MKNAYLIIIVTVLLFSACRSTQPVQNRFYLLEFPVETTETLPTGITPKAGKCEILPVYVAPVYASHQIAMREDSHSIRYFAFNEWAQRPGSRLTDMIVDYLESNNVFERTGFGRITDVADYIFETKVYRMEIDSQHDAFIARFIAEFSLIDNNTGKVINYHKADQSRELPGKDMNLFAAAISEIFAEELHVFIYKIMGIRVTH